MNKIFALFVMMLMIFSAVPMVFADSDNGSNEDECLEDADCSTDEFCDDGECEDIEDDSDENETEEDECLEDTDCEADEFCDDGECEDVEDDSDENETEEDECLEDTDCETDEFCDDGECEDVKDTEDDSDENKTEEDECLEDTDCEADEFCDDGECEEVEEEEGDDEDDSDDDVVDEETEEELEDLSYAHGAEYRKLQLEKAIKQALEGMYIVVEYLGEETPDEAYTATDGMETLFEEVGALEPTAEDFASMYVEYKQASKELIKSFRESVKDLLDADDRKELSQLLKEAKEATREEYKQKLQEKRQEMNRNRAEKFLENLGAQELMEGVADGDVTPEQAMTQLRANFKNMGEDKKEQMRNRVQEATKKKIIAEKRIREKVKEHEQQIRERVKKAEELKGQFRAEVRERIKEEAGEHIRAEVKERLEQGKEHKEGRNIQGHMRNNE